jgi:hypothetical protein
MGYNVISPIDLSSPIKLYSRTSVSEFQTGAQSVISTANLDIKNSNNSENANTNKVFATTTASDAITFHLAAASTDTASAATVASDKRPKNHKGGDCGLGKLASYQKRGK